MNKPNNSGALLIFSFLYFAHAPDLDLMVDAVPAFVSRAFGDGVDSIGLDDSNTEHIIVNSTLPSQAGNLYEDANR